MTELNEKFKTTVHAKCILTGEHAVLHGATAIAFPLPCYRFILEYEKSDDYELDADFNGTNSEELKLCFWPALEKCLGTLGHSLAEISGHFRLDNNMPIGAGLGFSACVSVAIARWLCFMEWITEKEIFHFAHKCESLFHGVSSGVDVAAVLSSQPIEYIQNQPIKTIDLTWQPNLYISNALRGSMTTRAVATTEHLWQNDPDKAKALCEQMQQASQKALQSITESQLSNSEKLDMLKASIDQAYQCYEDWGLVNGSLKEHIALLKSHGVQAVKPTGSGGDGGHVLSLWSGEIPEALTSILKPVFNN